MSHKFREEEKEQRDTARNAGNDESRKGNEERYKLRKDNPT
jgi:hypothetical protein